MLLMLLYNDTGSPFASRVRVQIYHKDLQVELRAPPGGGPASGEYRRINPLGLIPALVDEDVVISESLAIMEYLEDTHPEPSMRPADPAGRAAMRRIAFYHDGKIQPLLGRLFFCLVRREEDRQRVEGARSDLDECLGKLETIMGDGSFCHGETIGLADCVLVPTVHYAEHLTRALGLPSVLAGHDRLASWRSAVDSITAAKRVRDEIDSAMRAMQSGTVPD